MSLDRVFCLKVCVRLLRRSIGSRISMLNIIVLMGQYARKALKRLRQIVEVNALRL